MKKFFLLGLMPILALMMSMTFVSCGDDDDDENSSNPLVGTWKMTESQNNGDWTMSMTMTLKITETNYTMTQEFTEGDKEHQHKGGNRESGTYTVKDDIITAKATSYEYMNDGKWEKEDYTREPQQFRYTISGKTLTLYSVEGKEPMYVLTK